MMIIKDKDLWYPTLKVAGFIVMPLTAVLGYFHLLDTVDGFILWNAIVLLLGVYAPQIFPYKEKNKNNS